MFGYFLKNLSILRKFLVFNFVVFTILGLFTIVYLKAVQPQLIKKRASNHYIIIDNTIDHLQRLNINFNSSEIKTFLLYKNLKFSLQFVIKSFYHFIFPF